MGGRRGKIRVDEALVRQGLLASRAQAKAFVMAGDVLLGDHVVTKPAELVDEEAPLQLRERPRYVSRGGFKLEHALRTFEVPVSGRAAIDIGASTGGFTDCLLQHGARIVYAVDVGYGQLAFVLRADSRVVVMERVNARELVELPELVDIAVIDVSFISLRLIWDSVCAVTRASADVLALIKPQFEAGREHVNRRGVVTDEGLRLAVVRRAIDEANEAGLSLHGVTRSPLIGPAGNAEFLGWFRREQSPLDAEAAIKAMF
jgi:23S rRNA (cytidine1920-2'-O)/16S rRNA (cytidine1409-2'-O)-methyltransferase